MKPVSRRAAAAAGAAVAAAAALSLALRPRPSQAPPPASACPARSASGLAQAVRGLEPPRYAGAAPSLALAQACLAAADRSPAACAETRGLTAASLSRPVEDICTHVYSLLSMARPLAKGDYGAAVAACAADRSGAAALFRENAEKACRTWAEDVRAGRSSRACADMEPFLASGVSDHDREGFHRFCPFVMQETDCSEVPATERVLRLQCLAMRNVLAAARAGGSPEACAGQPACRALFTGARAECASLEARASEDACAAGLK